MINRLLLLVFFLFISINSYSWGFYAHKKINKLAVFTLPAELFGFYKLHLLEIERRAVAPDQRRGLLEDEGCKHFIDVDQYEREIPIDTIPEFWEDAVFEYSEDTLKEHGIAPWNIVKLYYFLVKAFKEKDETSIVKLSSDLGHYVADIHVPLHCTKNYNGQLTNQKGIHGLWESRLPELFDTAYNLFVGRSFYLESVSLFVWESVSESFVLKDTVLLKEKQLSDSFPAQMKYSYVDKGYAVKKDYSVDFSKVYHQKLNGMVEDRFRKSILMVGSIWYSAWVDGGSPKLNAKGVIDQKDESIDYKQNHLDRNPIPEK